MHTWEKFFEKIVLKSRAREMSAIKWMLYTRALVESDYHITDKITFFFTVLAYVLYGHSLSAEIAFPLFSYYQMIKYTMMIQYPFAISTGN